MISTGNAAELCGVTRDTVFKWVKKGKIKATRTAGGHFRINLDSIEPYLLKDDEVVINKDNENIITYCWEFHSSEGKIEEGCRQCMVFLAKAEKCYLVAGFGEKDDHPPGIHCKSSCFECEYFNFLDKPEMNVLLVTENSDFSERINSEISKNVTLKFSSCGYETSSVIQDYRPDFIVIDNNLVSSKPDVICSHLIKDPRVHGAQIILAVAENIEQKNLPDGICATILTPFNAEDLEKCMNRLRSNIYGEVN